MYNQYWALEIELCRIAANHGMEKEYMLSNSHSLSYDMRLKVEQILWTQVGICREAERLKKRSHLRVVK